MPQCLEGTNAMIHGSIYEDLLGHCRPYQAEAPWSRLHAELGIWELPSDTSSWLEPLREKYTADDLLESGVVTISRGKRLTPQSLSRKAVLPYSSVATPFTR